jgi:hypothetical protein
VSVPISHSRDWSTRPRQNLIGHHSTNVLFQGSSLLIMLTFEADLSALRVL